MVHLEKQVVEIAPDMTSILENGTEIMETPGGKTVQAELMLSEETLGWTL